MASDTGEQSQRKNEGLVQPELPTMSKTDQQLRQEITNARRLLRERRKQRWGTASKPTSYRRGEHEYLHGMLAHTQRRLEIFRNAGGEATWFDPTDPRTVEEISPAICQGCVEPHEVNWEETGEWHHNCPLRKKCDSVACALYVCPSWHKRYHNRVIAVRQR